MAEASNFVHSQAEYLSLNSTKVMVNVAEFRTKTGFFGKCYSAWSTVEAIAPQLWWQSFASKEDAYPIAHRILSIPPSSAAAERNWSLFSITHTKLRNRLSKDRLNKLITIRQNLRYCDEIEIEASSESADRSDDCYEYFDSLEFNNTSMQVESEDEQF